MDIPSFLLNQPITCDCGREHFVPIEKIVVADSLWEELQQYLINRGYRNVLVVADTNTYAVLGQKTVDHLRDGGFEVQTYVFTDPTVLLPDEIATLRVFDEMRQCGAHTVIAVGSGVINDIVRYATFQAAMPYISVPTAPSMDGYASSVAALQFAGVKTTKPAHSPKAIFCSPKVLSDAPQHLIQSGFGDLIGKVISLLDWKLANVLYGEYFCEKSYEIVLEPLRYCVENPEQLRRRNPEAVRNLFIGLVNAGIAMAMMGNSRPASGSEHHCSHFWDFLAYKELRQHISHGLQVGYATHWMMRFYKGVEQLEKLRDPMIPEFTSEWEANVRELYGTGADEIISAQHQKKAWLLERRHQWPTDSDGFRRLLGDLRPELSFFERVENALVTMGIPGDISYIGMNVETLNETFSHARQLRARYTVFDFLEGQGLLERFINDVVTSSK